MSCDQAVTSIHLRPRSQGANIQTWVGFKHILYLVEEAVLQWFRERGLGPQKMYHEHGLQLEVADCSALLLALMEVDDDVLAEARCRQANQFIVNLFVRRDERDIVSVKAKVAVTLKPGKDASYAARYPPDVASHIVSNSGFRSERRDLPLIPGQNVESQLVPAGSRAFLWTWRCRYPDCHYTRCLQHSTYIRVLEEVVDRFLSDRGISICRMLDERQWIPIVSRVRVAMLTDAHLDETIHTTFVIEDVMKGITFDGRMDCYAQRENRLVHIATARILHGYAISEGERAGQLTELDAATIDALNSEARR